MPFKPSLSRRIAAGKLVGLAVGLLAFFVAPQVQPDIDPTMPWALLLYYPTLGAIVGVYGVFTEHPVLDLPLPWWVRAPMIGGWMNAVIVLFAHEKLQAFTAALLGAEHPLVSPWWFVLEGAIVGMLIGWLATLIGGEGRRTLDA